MQITVGSYVRINEQCRNRAVRGLLCRVQALECRRSSAFVPTQFAQVRVLGLEEHIQGDAPEWWMPCSAIRYVGDASSCIGTQDAQAAARCFLPFLLSRSHLSAGVTLYANRRDSLEASACFQSSLEVPHVQWTMTSVAARLRQARACLRPLRREHLGKAQQPAHGSSSLRSGLSAHPVSGAVTLHLPCLGLSVAADPRSARGITPRVSRRG